MSEIPSPPELFEVFSSDPTIPDFRNIVGWTFDQGVWFLFGADRSTIALPFVHHSAVEIRPQVAS